MSPDDAPAPIPRPDVAATVVAWHNRHPLARRITAAEVHSVGLVVLPHVGSRRLFSEDLIPEIGLARTLDFAVRHGFRGPPTGDDWSVRMADLDRALVDDAVAAGPADRADLTLITAALMAGPRRVRLLIGRGPSPEVIGPRVWSRRRIAVAIGMPAALAVAAAAAWWAGAPSPSTTRQTPAGAASAPTTTSAPKAASMAVTASAGAATPAPAEASPPNATPAPTAAASAAADDAAEAPAAVDAPASAPTMAAAASESVPAAASAASATRRAPATPGMPPAGAVIAPRISIVPDLRPRLGASAASVTEQRYALVSPPMRSRAQAEALLRRLRVETSRIRHPSAVETSLLDSPQGWRVSWWPFANRRQADNAQAALVERRLDLQVVDF